MTAAVATSFAITDRLTRLALSATGLPRSFILVRATYLLAAGALCLRASSVAAQPSPVPPGEARRAWVELNHGFRHGVELELIDVGGPDGRLIVIGDASGYIYRSHDSGGSWQESRLSADESESLFIPLPRLEEIVLPFLGLEDSRSGLDLGVPDLADLIDPFEEDLQGGGELRTEFLRGASYLAPRDREEDPGDLLSQYVLEDDELIGINWLTTCETDDQRVYAATNDGVFRSNDAGASWLRVFGAGSDSENEGLAVACDFRDADRVFLGTASGFFYSKDGGISWHRSRGPWGAIWTCYVAQDPNDPERVHIGTSGGVFATRNLEDFELVYVPLWGSPESRVTCAVTPTEGNVFYVGSNDGAAVSRDGGRTFEPMAPDVLDRTVIGMIEEDPRDPRHAYVLTEEILYETWDAGRTVAPIYQKQSRETLRVFSLDPNDPDRVLLLSGSQLLAYEGGRPLRPPDAADPVALNAGRLLARTPPLELAIETALTERGLDRRTIEARRERARTRNALPQLLLGGWFGAGTSRRAVQGLGRMLSVDLLYDSASCWAHVPPPSCGLRGGARIIEAVDGAAPFEWGVGAVVRWELPLLAFDRVESHPVWIDVQRVRQEVADVVGYYWFERARVLRELAEVAHPPATMMALSIRAEETTALLDAITGHHLGF